MGETGDAADVAVLTLASKTPRDRQEGVNVRSRVTIYLAAMPEIGTGLTCGHCLCLCLSREN